MRAAHPACLLLSALLASCGGEPGALCGEGLDPVLVTGLNGTIDGVPAVEILLRVSDTCEVVDRLWMFWDDESETVSFGEEPTAGTLSRTNVDVQDRAIFFRDVGVGVRLDYPEEREGPAVRFVWFASGSDLAGTDCAGVDGAVICAGP